MSYQVQKLVNDIIGKRDQKQIELTFRNIYPTLTNDEKSFIITLMANYKVINNNTYTKKVNIKIDFDKIRNYTDEQILIYLQKGGVLPEKYDSIRLFLEYIFNVKSIEFIRRIFILTNASKYTTILNEIFNHLLGNIDIPNKQRKLIFLIDCNVKVNIEHFRKYIESNYLMRYYLVYKNIFSLQPLQDLFIDKAYHEIYHEIELVDILMLISKNIYIDSFRYDHEIEIPEYLYYNWSGRFSNKNNGTYNRRYAYINIYNYFRKGRKQYDLIDLTKLKPKQKKDGYKEYFNGLFKINTKKKDLDKNKKDDKKDDNKDYDKDNDKKLRFSFNDKILRYIPDELKQDLKIKKELSFFEFKKIYLQYLRDNKKIKKDHFEINKKIVDLNDLNYEIMNLLK